jgi:hypothetical protein
VTQLLGLADSVRGVLGGATKIVYAADWTEYGAHAWNDGAEVRFPLDPLFASPDIDAVGIDYYPPISDWRDGPAHADLAEARSPYDVAYLRRRLGEGEAFDWYYANAAARLAQARTPITDGAYGKPWIFRAKDLVSWWSNPHVERVGGVEAGTTAWVPQSKPIWLTEIGIPAVDKGPNGPNVFPDPKSSESAFPPLSRATRDDLVQARALEAILSRFDPSLQGFASASNPPSSEYAGRMVDPANVYVWAWDGRPYPAFPDLGAVWADGANWETGHWITGRVEGVALDTLIAGILDDFGLPAGALPVDGWLDGYVIDRPMSARAALEPLGRLFGLDAVASAGSVRWRGRGGRAVLALDAGDLVLPDREAALRLVRAHETELPHQVEVGFVDGEVEYRRAAVASRRLAGTSRRESRADAPVVTRRAEAQRLADAWLQDLWAGRETAEFGLSPRRIEIEPGDVVSVPTAAGPRLHRVVRIADGPTRQVTTRAVEPAIFETPGAPAPRRRKAPPPVPGKPQVVVLDLPAVSGEPAALQLVAVAAEPWPGAAAIWRSDTGSSFRLHGFVDLPAMIGTTLTALPPGPLWRFDPRSSLEIRISKGAVAAVPDEGALAGDNLFAVRGADGRWEILAAAGAELIGERTYRLSRLLRGLAGSEPEAGRTVAAGALVVRLDEAVTPLTASLADLNRPWIYRVGPAGRDHADPAFVTFTAAAAGEALRPFSPVRVTARREAGGTRIAWIRRGRRQADAWEPVDVPLGEDAESYELDILQGAALKRRVAVAAPFYLYPAAAELADFGGPQAALTLRVAQASAAVGRGFARTVTVPVL